MALSDISLTSAMRSSLFNLQGIDKSIDRTQMRLSTGRKVNSALDNPTNFFAAQAHLSRAFDLSGRKDSLSEGIQVISAANHGITAISSLLQSASAIADSALSTGDPSSRLSLARQFDEILNQIDTITSDSTYRGTNLLNSQSLTVDFAEASGQSSLTITGTDTSSSGLGVSRALSSTSASTSSTTMPNNNIALGGSDPVLINGDGSVTDLNGGSVPTGLSGVVSVSSGNGFTLALKNDGTVVAWGDDSTGQVTGAAGLANITAISAGSGTGQGFGLALQSNGTVVAWGDNSTGQTNIPAGLIDVTSISAGYGFGLALQSNGTVVAWGDNSSGQTNVPAGLTGVVAIAAGNNFSMALKSDGSVIAWGDDSSGQVTAANALTGIKSISAGVNFGLALKNDGTIAGFGDDSAGQISSIPFGTNFISVSAGVFNGLALDTGGNAVGWGALVNPGLPLAGAKTAFDIVTISANTWSADSAIRTSLDQVRTATTTIRVTAKGLSSNNSILSTRQDYIDGMINILQTGADNLTLADMNEEGANMLMLQTRQNLTVTSLRLGSQAAQSVMRLF